MRCLCLYDQLAGTACCRIALKSMSQQASAQMGCPALSNVPASLEKLCQNPNVCCADALSTTVRHAATIADLLKAKTNEIVVEPQGLTLGQATDVFMVYLASTGSFQVIMSF